MSYTTTLTTTSTMNVSDKPRRPVKACMPCRGMKRKCVIEEGHTTCTRCIAKSLACVIGPDRNTHKRSDFAYGRSCTRCYQLKRSCSASDTSEYPCTLCTKQKATCELRQTKLKQCKKPRKDAKSAVGGKTSPVDAAGMDGIRLSLAMNASYEALQAMDPNTLPEVFGLDYGKSSTWALLYFPRDVPPTSLEFLYQARVVSSCIFDDSFSVPFREGLVGKTLLELNTKTDAQYKQLLPHMKGTPGPPRRTQMLELTQIIDNKLCSVVLTHLHDNTGVARLQFARVFVLDFSLMKDGIKALDSLDMAQKPTKQLSIAASKAECDDTDMEGNTEEVITNTTTNDKVLPATPFGQLPSTHSSVASVCTKESITGSTNIDATHTNGSYEPFRADAQTRNSLPDLSYMNLQSNDPVTVGTANDTSVYQSQTRAVLAQSLSTDSGIYDYSSLLLSTAPNKIPAVYTADHNTPASTSTMGPVPPGWEINAWLDVLEANLRNENWFQSVDLNSFAAQEQNVYHQLPDLTPFVDFNAPYSV